MTGFRGRYRFRGRYTGLAGVGRSSPRRAARPRPRGRRRRRPGRRRRPAREGREDAAKERDGAGAEGFPGQTRGVTRVTDSKAFLVKRLGNASVCRSHFSATGPGYPLHLAGPAEAGPITELSALGSVVSGCRKGLSRRGGSHTSGLQPSGGGCPCAQAVVAGGDVCRRMLPCFM